MKRSAALAAMAVLTLAVAGCASADKDTTASAGSMSASMKMTNSGSTAKSHHAGGVSGSDSSMSGGMSMNTTTVLNAQGVPTPVPIQTIGSGTWKAMRITAETMTPVPFYVYNGSSFREIKPTKHTSFHLMVMLDDKATGVPIPYATVWAVISKNGRTVFNEPQWDMISRWMGPHYGNDVTLPGPGRYTLKLLISPPVAALHSEYNQMWIGRHTVTSTFTWNGSQAST